MKYYTIEISAENQTQAEVTMNALLVKKLVTGGQFINAPARFWWKGKIVDMKYVMITSFTVEGNKQQIIEVIEQISEEEVPMIRFIEFEGNKRLYNWIKETLDL